MSKLAKLFKTVSVVAIVEGRTVRVSGPVAPSSFAWADTRDAIVDSIELRTSLTIDKGTTHERSFRGTGIHGTDVAPFLAAPQKQGKGKGKGNRQDEFETLTADSSAHSNGQNGQS